MRSSMLRRSVLAGLLLLAAWTLACDVVSQIRFFTANDGTPARWEADGGSVEVAFELNRLLVFPLRIDGSESLRFVLDTGSPITAIISNTATERLGLELGESIDIGGSGSGRDPTGRIARGLTVSVADVHLDEQTVVVASSSWISLFQVRPGRHSSRGRRTTVVSTIPIGAGSVGVSARPILPKTLTTSGTSRSSRSMACRMLDASVIDIPGGAVGM